MTSSLADGDNRGGLFALVADRYAAQDAARMAELDRLCRAPEPEGPPLTCSAGHPLDGVRMRDHVPVRYCKICHAERSKLGRARLYPHVKAVRAIGQFNCACGQRLGRYNRSGVCAKCQRGG